MNRQSGRIGLYLVLIVMLVAGYFYLNNQVTSQSSYSMESMNRLPKTERSHPRKSTRTERSRQDLLLWISRVKARNVYM